MIFKAGTKVKLTERGRNAFINKGQDGDKVYTVNSYNDICRSYALVEVEYWVVEQYHIELA